MSMFASRVVPTIMLLSSSVLADCQERVPATPLITHNPYFSIWSRTDHLNGSDTTHWTGSPQPIEGVAYIDGKPYRFMGEHPDPIPAMDQTGSSITATHTRYQFREAGLELDLVFFTPAIISDLDVLSRPVTYLTWSAESSDATPHQVTVLLDVDPVIAVSERTQQINSFRNQTSSLNVLSTGSQDQKILNRSGDDLRIDWGYFHLAVPKDPHYATFLAPHAAKAFA